MPVSSLSIVTLTWNSEIFVEPLLRTLTADIANSGLDTELIVVDNGSTDRTLELITEHGTDLDLTVISLNENRGTTVSRNLGIRKARGDYILVLDSDTELPVGTLSALASAPENLPGSQDNIGIIHPRLIYPNGEFQESARRFPTLLTKIYRLLRMESRRAGDESIDEVLAGEITPVDYAISAAWLVPRRVFDQIGLLDETIFYAPEDVEFCARCWKNDLEVWYYPKVEIVHNCQRLTSKRPLTKLGALHSKDLLRFWWKYRFILRRPNPTKMAGTSGTTRR